MKRTQSLILAICASAMVLGGCRSTPKRKKKNTSTTSQSVTVDPSKPVASIAITKAPDKTSYYAQEKFDPTGMVVIGTFEDGTSGDVTQYCTFTPERVSGSTTAVVVSFGGKTASQPVTVTDWKSSEKEIFRTYLRGFDDVPYMPVSGAKLERDVDYCCVSYYGGKSSAELLESYVKLFDESWHVELEQDEYSYIYNGSKTVLDEDEEEYEITVSLYGLDEEGYYTNDGSGTFFMDVSDGRYISFEEFKPVYEYYLSFIGGYYDEDTYEILDFPDPIYYAGELDYIEVENDLDDDGSGYYVATFGGVSASDAIAFTNLFKASPKWTYYEDRLNEVNAYYHEGEDVAIGYYYNSSTETLLLLIHQYFATSWPTEKVANFVAQTNPETKTVVPAYNEVGIYIFEVENDVGYVLVQRSEGFTQADVDAYVKGMPSNWTSEVIIEEAEEEGEEDSQFYVCSSDDHSIVLQVALGTFVDEDDQPTDDHYLMIAIMPNVPLVKELNTSEIVSFYASYDETVASFPAFSVAAEKGGIAVEATQDYIVAQVFEATDEEFSAFLSGFTGDWKSGSSPEMIADKEYAFYYGSTTADAYIVDKRDAAGYHCILIQISCYEWTKTILKQFADYLGGYVPPYGQLTYDLEWQEDYSLFAGSYKVGDLKDQIVSALGSGWEFVGSETTTAQQETHYGTYYYYKHAADEYGDAIAEIAVVYYNDTYPTVTALSLQYSQTAYKPAQIEYIHEVLHGVDLPFIGLWEEESEHTLEGRSLYYSEEEVNAAIALFTSEDGWKVEGTGADAVITHDAEGGTVTVKFEEYYYWGLFPTGYYYWVIDYTAK